MSKWIDYDAIDYRFDRIQDQSPDFIGGVIYANACVQDAPSIETKEIKYFDEAEKVWKIGRVIDDE